MHAKTLHSLAFFSRSSREPIVSFHLRDSYIEEVCSLLTVNFSPLLTLPLISYSISHRHNLSDYWRISTSFPSFKPKAFSLITDHQLLIILSCSSRRHSSLISHPSLLIITPAHQHITVSAHLCLFLQPLVYKPFYCLLITDYCSLFFLY